MYFLKTNSENENKDNSYLQHAKMMNFLINVRCSSSGIFNFYMFHLLNLNFNKISMHVLLLNFTENILHTNVDAFKNPYVFMPFRTMLKK
jgi:hypothetical protein